MSLGDFDAELELLFRLVGSELRPLFRPLVGRRLLIAAFRAILGLPEGEDFMIEDSTGEFRRDGARLDVRPLSPS